MDRVYSDLSIRLEYWDYLKDVNTAYQKIQANFKGVPIYTEILCKLFRRMMESHGTDIKVIYDTMNSVGELPISEAVRIFNEIR